MYRIFPGLPQEEGVLCDFIILYVRYTAFGLALCFWQQSGVSSPVASSSDMESLEESSEVDGSPSSRPRLRRQHVGVDA